MFNMRVEIVPPKNMHSASSFYICRHLIYYSYLISTIPTPLYQFLTLVQPL